MSEAAGIGGKVERGSFLGPTALLSVPASPADADRRHHAGRLPEDWSQTQLCWQGGSEKKTSHGKTQQAPTSRVLSIEQG